MANLEKDEPTTKEEPDSFEKFAQEFHDAKHQQAHPENSDEFVEPTPDPEEPVVKDEPVVEEVEAKEPEAVEDPAKEPEVEEVVEETKPDDEDPEVQMYTLPDDEMYGALRGQKVTVAQLEEAGLIGKVITRDHQEMHNTKLYNQLKVEFDEKLEAAKAELAPKPVETPAVPVDPKVFADDIEARYTPILRKLAEAGSFEPDFIDAYPKFASQTANQIETMRMVGNGLVEAVKEIRDWVGFKQGAEMQDESLTHLDGAMAALAEEDDLYADLKSEEERTAFKDWMSDPENPQPWKKLKVVEELSLPQNLKGAFAAYRTDTRHLRTNKTPAAAADTRAKAALAGAGGGNSRPTSKAPVLNEFDQMKKEYEDSRARSFGR